MTELIIFMASVGPNVNVHNITDTYTSISKNLGIEDFKFYVVSGNEQTDDFIKGLIPENHLFKIVRSVGPWASDFNIFLSAHGSTNEFKYLIITQDDIVIHTPNFYNKSMGAIKGIEDKIGWIAYTNIQFYVHNASNSVRTGIYKDRKIFQQFECHNNNGTLDYPKEPVVVFGPYAHIPLIRMDHMLKIGPVPNWTSLFILVDEDWSYEALLKGFINIWIPDITYNHPNPVWAHALVGNLRGEITAHKGFINKWGFDENPSDNEINNIILKKYPQLQYLHKYSYEYLYLKDFNLNG
jgi:hypothetical protein